MDTNFVLQLQLLPQVTVADPDIVMQSESTKQTQPVADSGFPTGRMHRSDSIQITDYVATQIYGFLGNIENLR